MCCARYRSDTQVSKSGVKYFQHLVDADVHVDAADILPKMHTESCAYFVISNSAKPSPTTIYQLVQDFSQPV